MAGWIELGFGTASILSLLFIREFGIFRNNSTSSETLSSTLNYNFSVSVFVFNTVGMMHSVASFFCECRDLFLLT